MSWKQAHSLHQYQLYCCTDWGWLELKLPQQAYVSTWKKSGMDTQSSLLWGHNASIAARSTPHPRGSALPCQSLYSSSSSLSLQGIKRKIQVDLPKAKTTLSAISPEKIPFHFPWEEKPMWDLHPKEVYTEECIWHGKASRPACFNLSPLEKGHGTPESSFKSAQTTLKAFVAVFAPPSTCTPTSPHHCAPLLTYHHGNLTSPSMFLQPSHQQPEKICLFTPVLSWTHFWKWITFLPWASVSQSVKWEDRRKLPKPEILTIWGLSGIENVWQGVMGFRVLFPERII